MPYKQTITESGWSMVEMLGVLAIIGVLSIGGIAGYTYAMNKSKAEALNGSAVASGGGDACTLIASNCASGALAEGECACAPATEGQTCTDHTTNECGLGYYCQFEPLDCDDTKGGNPNGVCTAVGRGFNAGAYLKGPVMDWWSAYSWCKGNGMEPVTGKIAGIRLNRYYDNRDGNGLLYQYFREGIGFWTGHDKGDSCRAWYVYANADDEGVDNVGRYAYDGYSDCRALCQ